MAIIRFPIERRAHCAAGATVEHPEHGVCEVLDIPDENPMRRLLYRERDHAWIEADVRELRQIERPLEPHELTDDYWEG